MNFHLKKSNSCRLHLSFIGIDNTLELEMKFEMINKIVE